MGEPDLEPWSRRQVRRAVFLDRDGVIIRPIIRDGRTFAPTRLEDFEVLPGVFDAVEALQRTGFCIIVVTNQPDVAMGRMPREVVEEMHRRLRAALPLDAIQVCYHRAEDGCDCRKPKPGMLLEAGREWGLDLKRSIMIGDRWGDIAAGKTAGCRTILIGDGYGEPNGETPDARAESLRDASALIVNRWIEDGEVTRGGFA